MSWVIDHVRKIKKRHKTNCPFTIAKERGIIVQYGPFGETLGFFQCNYRIKFININSSLSEEMQRFVCAHELGHAVLHPDSNTPFLRKSTFYSIDKIEVEANTFAAELLIPDNVDCETIYEAAALYGVPKKLAHLKNF